MAVSTVSSLSEAFTAGVPLHMEETPGENGLKDKSGSPSGLPAIPEDGEEHQDKDVSMTDMETLGVNGKGKGKGPPYANGALGGEGDGEDGDEDEDDEEDDAVLQVHD